MKTTRRGTRLYRRFFYSGYITIYICTITITNIFGGDTVNIFGGDIARGVAYTVACGVAYTVACGVAYTVVPQIQARPVSVIPL